ncbi:site-specific integrase [Ruminococcaceae bacterium OttesenSCG-928-L11]|nr:site-specific integrase [Ruminococcaceae bacterium OttesenSCG-928-L11]
MAMAVKRGNAYKITVSVGYDARGKQIRHHMTWTPDEGMTPKQIEKELERQKILFEEDCRNSKVAAGNMKFETFAEQWFREYAEAKLKTRSIDRYRQYTARVYKAIGHLRMDRITTRTIQKLILNLSEDGVNERTGGKLSPRTVKEYIGFVSGIFEYAMKQGVVKENPCKYATLPSIPHKELDCFTLEEAQRFLDLLEDEPLMWKVFFYLAIYGGFRRGELFGLEWQDIEFDTGMITIRRISSYTKARGIFTDTPKTNGSCRSLKLPQAVISLLRQYQVHQTEERLKLGAKWTDTGRLFVTWDGKLKQPGSAIKWLEQFCKRTGMRQVNIHSFRHLNASLLINSGTDIKTVSSALGHTQVSTTLNIYAHTFAAAQAKAADAIADTLTIGRKQVVGLER